MFGQNYGRQNFRSIMSEGNFHMITSAFRVDVINRRQQKSSHKFAHPLELWDNWEVLLSMFYNYQENVTIDE